LTKNRVEQKLRLRVRCEGRIKSQSWVLYEQSVLPTTQTQTVSDKVAAVTYNSRILPNEVIESNSTLVFERDLTNRRRLDILFDLCRLSDSSYNRYIIYSKGDTIFYEQAASNDKSNLRYTIKDIDGFLKVFDKTQSEVDWSIIQPNEYILAEPHSGYNLTGQNLDEDASVSYIESLTYRDDDETLDIESSRQEIFDVMLNRLNLGSNSNI